MINIVSVDLLSSASGSEGYSTNIAAAIILICDYGTTRRLKKFKILSPLSQMLCFITDITINVYDKKDGSPFQKTIGLWPLQIAEIYVVWPLRR